MLRLVAPINAVKIFKKISGNQVTSKCNIFLLRLYFQFYSDFPVVKNNLFEVLYCPFLVQIYYKFKVKGLNIFNEKVEWKQINIWRNNNNTISECLWKLTMIASALFHNNFVQGMHHSVFQQLSFSTLRLTTANYPWNSKLMCFRTKRHYSKCQETLRKRLWSILPNATSPVLLKWVTTKMFRRTLLIAGRVDFYVSVWPHQPPWKLGCGF